MEQILIFYGIREKTVKATMMIYSSLQAFAPSPDGDTEYFNIKGHELKGQCLAIYLPLYFTIVQGY